MIKLTNDASGYAGDPLFITPESITSIQPWEGTTRILALGYQHFVTETPEEVARKVLEYQFKMERVKALAQRWANTDGQEVLVLDNQLDTWQDGVKKLAGLEE